MHLQYTLLALCISEVCAYERPKFKHFYPKYEYFFQAASQQCEPQIRAYQLGIRTSVCGAPCACAIDCLLSDTTGSMQANMASANVILGLTPAILVYVGPTVAEMAALSTWSPLLGIVLALASPAVNIQRVFSGNNVVNVVQEPVSVTYVTWHKWLQRRGGLPMRAAQIVKFVIVLGALFNTLENSIRLDLRTVPSFRCGVVGLPIAWSLLGVSVYIFAAVGVRMRDKKKATPQRSEKVPIWDLQAASKHSVMSEILLWIGSKVAIAVMIFGVTVLSSLLLISASDAVVVLVRYLLSAGICQMILLGELAQLRVATAEQQKLANGANNERQNDSTPGVA